MTAQQDPYVRVYYRISTDDKFRGIYKDDALLGCWLRLLIIADAMHPVPAHLPYGVDLERVQQLALAGLIDLVDEGMFVIHGLATERAKRSDSARTNATKRWQRDGDATAMRPHNAPDATAMRPHSDRMQTSDATAMLSDPIRTDPIHSAPLPERARYGLPHITDEVGRTIESITGRSMTTLHGTWAGELDRLVEERGADATIRAIRSVCANIDHPSWSQLVAGVRNTLEPLPGTVKPLSQEEQRKQERDETLRLIREDLKRKEANK